MSSTVSQAAPTASQTAIGYLNAALAIGQALATDAAAIATATGNTKVAGHISSGLSTFQSISGPVNDLEQLAASIFGMFSTLATAHAAGKAG